MEGMDGIGRVGVFGLLVFGLAGSLGWGKSEGGCPPRLQGGWGVSERTRGLGISWSHCCPHHLSDSSSSSQGHGSPGLGQTSLLFLPACPLADLRCIFTDGILTAVDATCFSTLASSGPACWVQSPVGTSSHLSLGVVVMSLSCAP